jgi:hypothetical protein
MKSILLSIIAALAFSYAGCQPAARIYPPHPRLLLLKGEEKRIQQKLKVDATYNFLHKIIIEECNDLLQEPVLDRKMIGKRLLRTSRELWRRIFFLAYSWRVTGDARYLKRAEKELLTVAAFGDWNPSHFLDVAEMTMGVAVGYDWLYAGLTPETRRILEDAIIQKGLRPSLLDENNAWLKANHNWNQVCNTTMAFGAIAIAERDPELARTIIERSEKGIQLPMAEYLPDGGYPEGYGYWSYGTTFNVLFLSAMEVLNGKPYPLASHPGFMKTPRYFLHMTGPSGWPFNYSDCDPKPLLNPAMFWFASRLKEPGLLAFESRLIEGHKNLHRIRELPALMVWALDLDLSKIPKPKELQWVGGGKNPVALLRSSWDPVKSIFVGLKGGSPEVAHGHMDIGSFVIDALGERWAIDLGHQDYNSLESKGMKIFKMKQDSDRWKVFRNSNFSHNTLTINKQLQNVEGYAPIISSTSGPRFRSAVTDLTGVYSINTKKALRGVAIVEDQYVAVRDEITLKIDGTVRWNMITGADVKIIDNRTAELTKNGKKFFLRVSEPSDAVLTTWSTSPPSTYDEANPGTVSIGFESRLKAGSEKVFTVLMMPGSSTTKSKMTIPSLKEWSSIN